MACCSIDLRLRCSALLDSLRGAVTGEGEHRCQNCGKVMYIGFPCCSYLGTRLVTLCGGNRALSCPNSTWSESRPKSSSTLARAALSPAMRQALGRTLGSPILSLEHLETGQRPKPVQRVNRMPKPVQRLNRMTAASLRFPAMPQVASYCSSCGKANWLGLERCIGCQADRRRS